jgi:hypothetical protein
MVNRSDQKEQESNNEQEKARGSQQLRQQSESEWRWSEAWDRVQSRISSCFVWETQNKDGSERIRDSEAVTGEPRSQLQVETEELESE